MIALLDCLADALEQGIANFQLGGIHPHVHALYFQLFSQFVNEKFVLPTMAYK